MTHRPVYGIQAHVHCQGAISIASRGAFPFAATASIHAGLGGTGPARSGVVAVGRRYVAASDPGPDRPEPPPHSALEAVLAGKRTGRGGGWGACRTPPEDDRGHRGRD